MAANLGVSDLRYSTTVQMGGASPVTALQSAAMAVDPGHCAQRAGPLFGWNGYSEARISPPRATLTRRRDPITPLSQALRNYYCPLWRAGPGAALRPGWRRGTGSCTAQRTRRWARWLSPARFHAQHNPRAYMYGRTLTIGAVSPIPHGRLALSRP